MRNVRPSKPLAILITILVGTTLIITLLHTSPTLYTKVGMVFAFDKFVIDGRELFGSVSVGMIAPGKLTIKTFKLREVLGKKIIVDLKEAIEAWREFFEKEMPEDVRASRRHDIPTPTISISMILHDNKGYEYIASYTYSTYDYLFERVGDLIKVVKEIIKDPLAMFRRPLIIAITPEDLTIRKTDLKPMVERIKKFRKSSLLSNNDAFQTSSCPGYFTQVYWNDLYNSKDSPPSGWVNRFYGDFLDYDMKAGAWEYYASKYSLAYYFRSDLYTAEVALSAVEDELGPERITSMWSFFYDIFYELYGYQGIIGLKWLSTITPGSKFHNNTPVIGVKVNYVKQEPIEFEIEAEKIQNYEYKHGFSLLGVIFLGQTETITYYFKKATRVTLEDSKPKKYIMVPTEYVYDTDGVAVTYDLSLVNYGGCDYWRVIPISTFIPIYIKTNQDWNSAYVLRLYLNEPDPKNYKALVWSYDVKTIFWDYIDNSIPDDEPFFIDASVSSKVSENDAGLIVNLMKGVVTNVLSKILSSSNPLMSLMVIIVGEVVGYTEVNAWKTAIILDLEAWRYDNIDGDVYVAVSKITIKDISSEFGNFIPLMIRYQAQVGYSPYPGPLKS